jgi:peptidoglycan LD-endopeptidase CwlK
MCKMCSMTKKYLYSIFIFLTLALAGCAGVPRAGSVGVILPAQVAPMQYGSIQNPIIDSDIALSDGLRKWAPTGIKRKQEIVDVLYYSFDGRVHKGQIVVDERLTEDIQRVFNVILETRFPVTSVVPISHDKFNKNGKFNSDGQSMKSNNTSGFNYRRATGSKRLSMHSYGYAIDINPVLNPYIKRRTVFPRGAVYDPSRPGTLTRDCPVVRTFIGLGWTWGGNWKTLKDYQHFEKVLPR